MGGSRNHPEPRSDQSEAAARVVILGLARQGIALARYFHEKGARVIVSDARPADQFEEARDQLAGMAVEYVFAGHPLSLLDGASLICLSGGVPTDLPVVEAARRQGIPLTNDAQLFLQECPAPVIGITGSAGKTTTTTLVGRMLAAQLQGSQRRVWVGGNIGQPLLNELTQIRPEDGVVMELSSFQLELMSSSPQVAAVLNITPNHLDRHKTMRAYTQAKAGILSAQTEADHAVLGREDPGAWALREHVRGTLVGFGIEPFDAGEGVYQAGDALVLRWAGREQRAVPLGAIELRGAHNRSNVAAACALAACAGVEPGNMEAGVRGFTGVPHRLEFIRRVRGADWYNDSIATAPERALAAVRAFEEPLVLLAGGRDKDLPWDEFARTVVARVDHMILFGEAAEKIAAELHPHMPGAGGPSLQVVSGLDQAVAAAAEVAEAGQVVLLAPGGTSFDEFPDFAARGERFRALVEAL
jgi:UDP-N-acetylmuramoylalanine--D-glutamate ligase